MLGQNKTQNRIAALRAAILFWFFTIAGKQNYSLCYAQTMILEINARSDERL